MQFFKKIRRHFKIKKLQQEFDQKIADVQRLLSEKNVEASGKVLLEAEALRKEIQLLTEEERDGEEQTPENSDQSRHF